MPKYSEEEFIRSIIPDGETAQSMGIEPMDVINEKLNGVAPPFSKRGIHPKEFTVLGVTSLQEIEGLYKVSIVDVIPPGEKILARKRQYVIVSDTSPTVITPVVIKSGESLFVLLCAQDRLTLGGKVSIEVYRGTVKEGTENRKLSQYLLERKLPDITYTANLLEVRNLGYFWNNTGNCGIATPVQALFYFTEKPMTAQELKAALKPEYGLDPDPKKGPPLHNTEPILRTFSDIESRFDEVLSLNLETESNEAYINDVFSTTALAMLLRSISKSGFPY